MSPSDDIDPSGVEQNAPCKMASMTYANGVNGSQPGHCCCGSATSSKCGRNCGTLYGSGVIFRPSTDETKRGTESTDYKDCGADEIDSGNGDNESVCFTSLRHNDRDKQHSKHVRKYYKHQNALIDAYESLHNQPGEEPIEDSSIQLASFWSKVTFTINFILLLAKIVAAVLSGSLVVISSMLDSAMDLVSGALMWWSNRAIKKTNPFYYPRGRRKLEPVAIVVLAVIMSFVSVQVIQESIQKIVIYSTHIYDDELQYANEWLKNAKAVGPANTSTATETTNSSCLDEVVNLSSAIELVELMENTLTTCASQHGAPVFELPTIMICLITIVTKLILYLVCRRISNHSVQALAKDHFNDVISNTGAVACGIIGYHVWKYADPLGAIIISASIIVNWSITAHSQIKMLTGYTAQPDFLKKITWIVLRHDDRIKCIQRVIAFHFGSRFLVEVHIVLPAEMTMKEAHDLSEALQFKIERIPDVERAFVHTDYDCKCHSDNSEESVVVTTTTTNHTATVDSVVDETAGHLVSSTHSIPNGFQH